jgi:hypothetical protein
MCKHMLEWAAAGFAFLAAIAWIISAVQKLPDLPTKQFTGASNVGVPELVRKLRWQSTWSAIAAIAAALAAVAQACSLLVP